MCAQVLRAAMSPSSSASESPCFTNASATRRGSACMIRDSPTIGLRLYRMKQASGSSSRSCCTTTTSARPANLVHPRIHKTFDTVRMYTISGAVALVCDLQHRPARGVPRRTIQPIQFIMLTSTGPSPSLNFAHLDSESSVQHSSGHYPITTSSRHGVGDCKTTRDA